MEVRRAGEDLAGGYFAELWAILCDLDVIWQVWKLRSRGGARPCSWCDADNTVGSRPWSDFRLPNAVWMSTVYDEHSFNAAFPDLNPLFAMAGISVYTLWPDYMHIKHLGVDMYFLGSILVIITFMCDIPGCHSWQHRLSRVWDLCMEWYSHNQHDATSRYTTLLIGMFSNATNWRNKFPKLKGKAAEVKQLVPALLHAWGQIKDPLNDLHTAITLGLRASLKLDRILDEYSTEFMFPPDVALEFEAVAFVYLNHFSLLAERFNIDGDQLFDVTVKCHMLAHTAMRASELNPRRTWRYNGERFMLLMRRIVQASVRGT